MNQHLTCQQISEYLISSGSSGNPEEAQHRQQCATCQAEIERLELPLTLFRVSTHYWAKRHWADRQPTVFETERVLLLTPESLDWPWYRGILAAIKEAIHPPELPPLELTSRPVEVPRLWGSFGGHEKTAGLSSVLIHCTVVAVLLVLGSMKPVQRIVRETAVLIAPDLKPYLAKKDTMNGGGGGGARQALDASKGKLPKIARRQFTPPRVDPVENPKLPMLPAIIAEAQPPDVNLTNYGDPLSHLGIPSSGTGLGGGIGSGIGGGVGPGRGSGFGSGSGGGFGGGAYAIGGGVSAPAVLSKVEPEYSEEARKAKWQGTVVLQLVVDEHGVPAQMRVMRALGLGLDQKAMEAVAKWRFRPGIKDGKPVPVIAIIEVNFRLL